MLWRFCISNVHFQFFHLKCPTAFSFKMSLQLFHLKCPYNFFIWNVLWDFAVSIFFMECRLRSFICKMFQFFIWIVFSGFVWSPPTRTAQVCDRRRPVAEDRRPSDLGQEQSDVRQLQVKDRYANGFYNLKMSRKLFKSNTVLRPIRIIYLADE